MVNGYQFNKHSFLGVGVGLDGYSLVYADYRHTFYCKRRKVRPFLEARVGIAYDYCDLEETGDYWRASVGCEFPISNKAALQFSYSFGGTSYFEDLSNKISFGICF